jgi:Holliday junction resolvase RusA-like endonuclease
MTSIYLTILGEPCSKANSRRIVTIANRPASIKSKKAIAFEQSALLQIPASAKQMLECDVRFTATIYYASRRPDLDESILMDILQAKFKGSGKGRELIRKGVYLNDRQIKEKRISWGLDKHNPRAEIEITAIG